MYGRFGAGRFASGRFGSGISTLLAALSPLFWRDPSDLSTLFQDASGLVPVTAVGEPVRRLNNKGTLGGYFLAPSAAAAPAYQADGTYHWLESDGVDDVLEYQGTVPFSVNLFEAVAFRTLSIDRPFAHIMSNRGGGPGDLAQRHPLISSAQAEPQRIICSFGGVASNVDTPGSLIGVDTVVSTSNSASQMASNVNGVVATRAGVALTDGGTEPYRVFGPNAARIRDYGGVHLNRVPTAEEEAFIRSCYAAKSGGIA
ncbi:hypothetical protein [Ruegeria arenilitoris]|uniref:hypothetical protein n=1 Tax=Ruegeria arenilitoris TaxID=1173585 RepID=UPI00147DD1A6|nr:hypothetical protein [Ruegeria arenilitoris]